MNPFGTAGATGAMMLALATVAQAQTLQHPPHGQEHPFHGWKDERGLSCCDLSDCVMAEMCKTTDGREGWREDGRCWALPQQSERPAPKGLEFSSERQRAVCRIWGNRFGQKTLDSVRCWAKGYNT